MNTTNGRLALALSGLMLAGAGGAWAQDWSQWRGANRDGKASGFKAPEAWPKELNQKWKAAVGRGDATPAIVGDKLFIFARDETAELTVCLDATTGKELWKDKYEAAAATEPRGQHPGPRSSPAVAEGKVVTYGVRGTLSCLDAATGKMLWRKDDFKSFPRFFTGSSPIIVDGLCIAQLGGENQGGVVAYDLTSGEQKWKWTEDGSAYSSPELLTVGGVKMLATLTAKKVVGLGVTDGKLLWELPFAVQGMAYNAATPIVDGDTVIYSGSGRGTKAVKIEKTGDAFAGKELWSNPDNGVQFNSPVLKNGQVYGISAKGDLFCLDAKDGKTLWTTKLGGGGFGSVVDAGPVLLALIPQGDLVVFAPSDKEYKNLTTYKVGADIYAYPVPSSRGLFVKDKDSVALWTAN